MVKPYQPTEPPPRPDTRQPRLVAQTIVDVVYSASGSDRAIIGLGSDGVYRVRTEHWNVSEWYSDGLAFWSQCHLSTFTDTLEDAKRLAEELLPSAGHGATPTI
jgi:hypothetical protein